MRRFGIAPNPFKNGREDTTMHSRVLSLTAGIGAAAGSVSWWMRNYDYNMKSIGGMFKLPMPSSLGVKQFLGISVDNFINENSMKGVKFDFPDVHLPVSFEPMDIAAPEAKKNMIESIRVLEDKAKGIDKWESGLLRRTYEHLRSSIAKYKTYSTSGANRDWAMYDRQLERLPEIGKVVEKINNNSLVDISRQIMISRKQLVGTSGFTWSPEAFNELDLLNYNELRSYREVISTVVYKEDKMVNWYKTVERNMSVVKKKLSLTAKLYPAYTTDPQILSQELSIPMSDYNDVINRVSTRAYDLTSAVQDTRLITHSFTFSPSYTGKYERWMGLPGDFMNTLRRNMGEMEGHPFWDYKNQLFPEPVYNFLTNHDMASRNQKSFITAMKSMHGGDGMQDIHMAYREIMRSAKLAKIRITAINPVMTKMEGSDKIEFNLEFLNDASVIAQGKHLSKPRQVVKLKLPFINSKHGRVQMNPDESVRIWNDRHGGHGVWNQGSPKGSVTAQELQIWHHNLTKVLRMAKTDPGFQDPNVHVDGAQKIINSWYTRLFLELDQSSGKMPTDLMRSVQFAPNLASYTKGHQEQILGEAIPSMAQVRELGIKNKPITFLSTRFSGDWLDELMFTVVQEDKNKDLKIVKQYIAVRSGTRYNISESAGSSVYLRESSKLKSTPKPDVSLDEVLTTFFKNRKGVIVGNSSKDAINKFKNLMTLRLEKTNDRTLRGVLNAFVTYNDFDVSKRKFVDVQRLKLMQGVPTIGNLDPDWFEEMIQIRLDYLRNIGDSGEAEGFTNRVYKQFLGVSRSELVEVIPNKNGIGNEIIIHDSALLGSSQRAYTQVKDIIWAKLWGNYNWDKKLGRPGYYNKVLERIGSEKYGINSQSMDAFVSQALNAQNVRVGFDPNNLIPGYEGTDKSRAIYQIMNPSRLESKRDLLNWNTRFPSHDIAGFASAPVIDDRFLPPVYAKGQEQFLMGLRDYSRIKRVLYVNFEMTYDSQMVSRASEFPVNVGEIREVIIDNVCPVDPKTNAPLYQQPVKGNVYGIYEGIGTHGGKVITTARQSQKIIEKIDVTSTTQRILLQDVEIKRFSQPWIEAGRKQSIGHEWGRIGGDIQELYYPKVFDGEDTMGLARRYLARLSRHIDQHKYKMGKDYKDRGALDIINKGFGKFFNAHRTSTGSVKVIFDKAHIDVNYLRKSDFFARLGKIYRDLDLYQSVATNDLGKIGPNDLINYAVENPLAHHDPKAYHEGGVNALMRVILHTDSDDTAIGRAMSDFRIGEPSLPGWKRDSLNKEFLTEMAAAVKNKDVVAGYNLLLHAPERFQMYQVANGSYVGQLAAGFPLRMMMFGAPNDPLGGIGGKVKVNQMMINAFRFQPGSGKLVNFLEHLIETQSAMELGRFDAMSRLGAQNITDPKYLEAMKFVTDYEQVFKQGFKLHREGNIQELLLNFQKGRNIARNYPQLKNIVSKLKIVDYQGDININPDLKGPRILDEATRMVFNAANIDDLELSKYMLDSTQVVGKVFPTETIELLNHTGPGYIKNPKGTSQFAYPGTGRYSNIGVLLLRDPALHIHRIGAVEGIDLSVLGDEELVLKNLMIHAKAGDTDASSGGIASGFGNAVKKIRDLIYNRKMKRHYNAMAPLSATGNIQYAQATDYKTLYAEMNADKLRNYGIAHEAYFNKEWLLNNSVKIENIINQMDIGDMQEAVKYMKQFASYRGMKSGPFQNMPHPTYKLFKGVPLKGANSDGVEFDFQNYDTFFDLIMKGNIRRQEMAKFRAAWTKGVTDQNLPIFGGVGRWPLQMSFNAQPMAMFFRSVTSGDTEAAARDATLRISALNLKYMGGDMDADIAFTLMASPGMRETFAGQMGGKYSESQALGIERMMTENGEPIDKVLFYNGKTGNYEWLSPDNKKITRMVNQHIDTLPHRYKSMIQGRVDTKELSNMHSFMSNFMKTSPGTATKLSVTMHNFLKNSSIGANTKAAASMWDNLGMLTEWGIKQKGAKAVHPVYLLNVIENLHEDKAYNLINSMVDFIPTKARPELNITFTPDQLLYARRGLPMEEFPWAFNPKDHQDFIQAMKNSVPEMASPYIERHTNFRGGKYEFRQFIKAMSNHHKGLKWGIPSQIAETNAATLKTVMKHISQSGQRYNAFFMHPMESTFPMTPDKRLMNNTMRNLNNVINQKVAGSMTVGNIAGAAALGVFALTFFNPDQSKGLGHMPGLGGEHWDYQFATPELGYEKFMQAPLGNPYDLPKTYLNLFNSSEAAMLERKAKMRGSRHQFERIASSMAGGYYSRNSYSSSSNYLQSNVRSIAERFN